MATTPDTDTPAWHFKEELGYLYVERDDLGALFELGTVNEACEAMCRFLAERDFGDASPPGR